MSNVVTTPPVAQASPASIKYLNDLFEERYEGTLDASQYEGKSQSEVSAMIQTLLKSDGNRLPTDEALAKLSELASLRGCTIEPRGTLAGVNRQIREIERNMAAERKHAARVAYARSASEFDAFLTTLTADQAAKDSADIPF